MSERPLPKPTPVGYGDKAKPNDSKPVDPSVFEFFGTYKPPVTTTKAKPQPVETDSTNILETFSGKELVSLLYGDKVVANRLLEETKRRYPTRSVTWQIEKTINDIHRDRA
jgi:hypothetical protein